MTTRGEKQFIQLPKFAARLYDNLTSVKGVNKSFDQIAEFITSAVSQGKLLDIGTGPGRLLAEIYTKNPQLELYGLDISSSMVELARHNLETIHTDLRVGNIRQTDFADSFFDCVICSGSFYLWDEPVQGLNEIYRILKPRMKAYLFESNREHDKKELNIRLNENLRGYGIIRRFLSRYFMRKQLRMTYSSTEIGKIISQSKFQNQYGIYKMELGNLPIWLRIELQKI
jgi:ubiquinone/menaquinone biosynthesis C-methylase UbiE